MPKFLRHISHKYSKLGVRRKKKQIWRRPTGRDNKMREQRRGHGPLVAIGYSTAKQERGKIEGKTPMRINNVNELNAMQKDQIAVLGKIGNKKKIEIAKKAKELKIQIHKLNIDKFLKLNDKPKKEEKKTDHKEAKKWI